MLTTICIALLLTGLGFIFFGTRRFLRDRQLAASASNWASAGGEILSASLDVQETLDSDQERVTVYRPVIHYRYPVGDSMHEGSRVWLNREVFGTGNDANAWLTAHPAGGPITVRYDPAQPTMATLVVDKPSLLAAIAMIVFGIVFAWVGGSLLMG